jgi:hypothetical protein
MAGCFHDASVGLKDFVWRYSLLQQRCFACPVSIQTAML